MRASMLAVARGGVGLTLLASLAGCQLVLDIQEWGVGGAGATSATSTGSTATSTTSTASGTVTPCGDGTEVCRPVIAVSDGSWTVAGAFVDGPASSCPSKGPIREVATTVAPGTCVCGVPPPGKLCDSVAAIADHATCTSVPHKDMGGCNVLGTGGPSALVSPSPSLASCSIPILVPPPTLVDPKTLCAAVGNSSCGAGEVCVPPATHVCIAHDDDVACPPGYEPAMGSPFTIVTSSDCNACGKPASKCRGTATLWSTADCLGRSAVVPNDNSCQSLPFDALSFTYLPDPADATASCGAEPLNVETRFETVCCLPQ